MQEYKTILKPVSVEFVERRSRFIGHVCPVESEEEALKYSQGLKSENGMNTGAYSNYVDEKEESEA